MTIGVNCLIILTAEVEDDLAEAIFSIVILILTK